MYRIGQICKSFGLSRSTLLYYDSIGLLKAKSRTSSNYRVYTEEDFKRLEQIAVYREAGVPLKEIITILDTSKGLTDSILEKRLTQLNQEINKLKTQQQLIVQMLKSKQLPADISAIGKETLVTVLISIGLDEDTLHRLHIEFEKTYPEKHQSFLEFLGISEEEIRQIRENAR